MQFAENYGSQSENLVKEYLQDLGHFIVCQNFEYRSKGRQGRRGEIDLITEYNNILHIIEVKARKNKIFGSPREQINYTKLKHIYYSFQYFLLKKEYQKYRSYSVQFDVAEVFTQEVNILYNAASFEVFLV